jgi:hypothetical protein
VGDLDGMDMLGLRARLYFGGGDETGEVRLAILSLLAGPKSSLYDSVERRIAVTLPEVFEGLEVNVIGEGIDVGTVCVVGQSSAQFIFPSRVRGTPVTVRATFGGAVREWHVVL